MKFNKALLGIPFLLSACVYGPKAERKSPLNYLNGEHYEQSPEFAFKNPAPILKRKDKETEIKGIVQLDAKPLPQPINRATVTLKDSSGKKIADTTTNVNGGFKLHAKIHNGRYSLEVSSRKYYDKKYFTVDKYNIENLIITIDPSDSDKL